MSATDRILGWSSEIESIAGGIQTKAARLDVEQLDRMARGIRRRSKRILENADEWDPSGEPTDPTDPTDPPDPPVDPPSTGDPVIGNLPIETTIQKNGGACASVKADNRQFLRTSFRYGQWMGISVPKQDPVDGNVGLLLDECEFVTGWAGDYKGWGIRGYDMGAFHYRKCEFVNELPKARNIEHGNYQNIWSGGLLEDCIWWGCAGQGSQYVWSGREGESANFTGLSGKDIPGDVVHYRGGGMYNCGFWGNGRASFALSMFRGQVGLKLESFTMQKNDEPQIHGAILFDGNSHRQSMELLHSMLFYDGIPDREAIQVWRPKHLLVDGGEYHSVKGMHVIDPKPGTLEFTGNIRGHAPLWIGHTTPNGQVWDIKTTMQAASGTTF